MKNSQNKRDKNIRLPHNKGGLVGALGHEEPLVLQRARLVLLDVFADGFGDFLDLDWGVGQWSVLEIMGGYYQGGGWTNPGHPVGLGVEGCEKVEDHVDGLGF